MESEQEIENTTQQISTRKYPDEPLSDMDMVKGLESGIEHEQDNLGEEGGSDRGLESSESEEKRQESEFEEEEEPEVPGEDLEEVSVYSMDSETRDRDHCEVCYSEVSRRFMQNEIRHLFDLIRCKNCNKTVHHICYGINTPVEPDADDFGKKYFLCDYCKEGPYGQELPCYICGTTKGCLRITRDRKWIHSICGMGSPSVLFRDVSTMNIDLASFKKRGNVSKKCSICKTKAQTLECINENINKSCHLHCALRREHLKPRKSKWRVLFELYPKKRLALHHHVEENAVSSNIEDIAAHLKEVAEETGMAKSLNFPKDLKPRRGTRANKERRRRREGTEIGRFVRDVYESTQRRVERNFEDDYLELLSPRENEERETDTVGGRIIVVNTTDMTPDEEELVQGRDDEEEEFMEIEGLTPFDSMSQVILEFYQEIASINTLLEVYSEEKLAKLRGDLRQFPALRRLSFPEVLFFANVYQSRAQAALNNLCTTEDLEILIKSASVLPFSLVGILRSLNEKYYTNISADILLRHNIEQCAPQSAYIPSKKRFDDLTIRRNKKTIQQARKLERIYINDPCRGITEQSEELRDYYRQLLFLNELYSQIADYFSSSDVKSARTTPTQPGSRLETPSKGLVVPPDQLPNIPPAKVLSLYSQASKLFLSRQFGEINLLKEFVGGTKDLLGYDALQEADVVDMEADFSESERLSTDRFAEGKRSIGKYMRPMPIAAVSVATNQIGRPKKPERIVNEVEKDHKLRLSHIRAFPTLEEVKRALAAAERDGYQRRAEMLEASLDKVRDWKNDFATVVEENDGSLGNLIQRIEQVGVYIDDMAKALEYRKEWTLWRSSVISLHRRLKKKVEDYFGDISDMVSFEELEDVINEGKNIIHLMPEDEALQGLREKYRAVQQVREELNDRNLPVDLPQLKQFKKDLKNFNVRIPELRALQQLIASNENIKNMIDEPIGLKKLEEKVRDLEPASDRIDPNLWRSLKAKITEGKRIQDKAKTLLKQKTTYTVEDIADMARLIKEANKHCIDVDEVDQIKKSVDEFLRLAKIYAVLVGTDAVDSEKLEHNDYEQFTGKSVDDLLEMCQEALRENEATIDETKAKELEEAYSGFSYESVDDVSVRKYFDRMSIALWKAKAKIFAEEDSKRTSHEIARLIADIPSIDQLSKEDREAFGKVQQSARKVRKWKEDMQKFLDTNPRQALLDLAEKAERHEIDRDAVNEQFDEIRNNVNKLSAELEKELSMYVDLQEENSGLKKINRWIDWISDVLEMKRQIEEEHKPIDSGAVKIVFEKIDKLGLPKSKGICKTVTKWNQMAGNLQKEFVAQYQKKRVEPKRVSLEGSVTKKLLDRNKNKMNLDEAKLMIEKLEGSSTVITLPEQVQQVKDDLKVFNEWKEKVNEVNQKYVDLIETQELGQVELDPELVRELARLRADMLSLPIRDERAERDLLALNWTHEAVELLQEKDGNYDTWKKLLRDGDRLDAGDKDHILRLAKALEQEIQKADRLKAIAKALKKAESGSKDNKISFNALSVIVEETENTRILLKDEKRTIDNTYELAKRLSDKTRGFTESIGEEKPLENEFLELRESIEKLPVDLSSDLKLIDAALQEGHKLAADVQGRNDDDPKWEEKIAWRYLHCPVYIEKANRIAKNFEGLQVSAASLKQRKEDLEEGDKIMDYSELATLSKQIENFERINGETDDLTQTKLDIFVKKSDILEKKMYGSKIGPNVQLTLLELKNLLREGVRIQRTAPQDEDLERAIQRVEDIMKQVEAKIEEIKAAKDVGELEKFSKIFNEIVDLSDEVTSRKDLLSFVKAPKPLRKRDESEGEPKRRVRGTRVRSESQDKRRRRSKERSRERIRRKPGSTYKGERERKRKPSPVRYRERDLSGKRSLDKERDRRQMLIRGDDRLGAQYQSITARKSTLATQNKMISKIKEILDQSRNIELRVSESFMYAEIILNAFPEIYESTTNYETILQRLKRLVDSPYIAKSLLEMNFEEVYLRHLASQDPRKLKEIEQQLRSETVRNLVNRPPPKQIRQIPEESDESEESDKLDDKPIPKKPRTPTPHRPSAPSSVRKPSVPKHSEEETRRTPRGTPRETPRKPQTPRQEPPESPVQQEGQIPARKLEPALGEGGSRLRYEPAKPRDQRMLRRPDVYNPEVSLARAEDKPLREDSILKIFSGMLSWDETRVSPRMILYSCDSLDKALRIPGLTPQPPYNELRISKQTDWKSFEEYFTNILRIWKRQTKDIELMSGWVEAEASIYQSRFEQIANELLAQGKVGVCEYIESARLIFMHKQQMRRDWATQLGLKVRKARQSSRATLYFVIVHRGYRLSAPTISLSPIMVKAIAEHIFGKESLAKTSITKDQLDDLWIGGSMHSPGKSSLGDFEQDYGLPLEDEEEAGVELGKRTLDQVQRERRDGEALDIEKLVKKIKSGRERDHDDLVEQLQGLEQEEITEIARNLEPNEREAMMEILMDAQKKEVLRSRPKEPYYVEPKTRGSTEAHLQENIQAFAGLEPSEVVERYSFTITTQGEEGQPSEIGRESLAITEELRKLIESLPGVSIAGQFVTLSKELYDQVKNMQRELGIEPEPEERKEEEGMQEEATQQGKQERTAPRKVIINDGEVEIEEESVTGEKKPAEGAQQEEAVSLDLEKASQEGELQEEVAQAGGQQQVERREGEARTMYVESTTTIVKETEVIDLEGDQEGQFSPDNQVHIVETVTTTVVVAPGTEEDNQDNEGGPTQGL